MAEGDRQETFETERISGAMPRFFGSSGGLVGGIEQSAARPRLFLSIKKCSPSDPLGEPAIYLCVSRAVDRRFIFGDEEREKFRTFMRMQENFSGCRVLSYCAMSNHFHILLEVPVMPEGGITDRGLLKRLMADLTLPPKEPVGEREAGIKRIIVNRLKWLGYRADREDKMHHAANLSPRFPSHGPSSSR